MNLDDAARAFVGVPYRLQGRTEEGLDCVGLLWAVGRQAAILPPDYNPDGYGLETDGVQLREELSKWADEIEISQAARGDIGVFSVAGLPQHVAIFSAIDYGQGVFTASMIHASRTEGRVIEHVMNDKWRRRLVSVWRMKNG